MPLRLSPRFARTLARGAKMTEHGILILRFTPRQIRVVGREVASQIRAVFTAPTARPLPKIVAKPA